MALCVWPLMFPAIRRDARGKKKHIFFDAFSLFLYVEWLRRSSGVRECVCLFVSVCVYVCGCVCDVMNPPCPSGWAALWSACRLLCQRWCPAGTRGWHGAPTLASRPPWFTCSRRNLATGAGRKQEKRQKKHKRGRMQMKVWGFALKRSFKQSWSCFVEVGAQKAFWLFTWKKILMHLSCNFLMFICFFNLTRRLISKLHHHNHHYWDTTCCCCWLPSFPLTCCSHSGSHKLFFISH